MSFAPVAVGDTIAGKYLVERIIGEGGMGLVIAARHLELDQTVAIKFLLAEIARLDNGAERFKREAWAAARIRGEHVCRVLDVGTLPSGVPYMVMEYLDGCDLATELAAIGAIPAEEAVDYVLQACEALAEAHAAGVIHRDLKPANLFLASRADGSRAIKVLDFGVSKVLSDGAGLSLTSTKTLVGSPLYMSPEQLDSAKGVDARTDIWALGVVLYELITGRTPFNGDSIAQLVSGVLHQDPPSFVDAGAAPMGDLEAVVRRAVSKRREDRYATVAELAAELVPFGPPHSAQSAQRVSRMLAREGMSSLPVSMPSGERLNTPRGSLDQANTPRGSLDQANTPRGSLGRQRTPNRVNTPRGSLDQANTPRDNVGRDSTPVSWEQSRAASRRKRVGIAALALLGTAAIAIVVLQSSGTREVPPGAGPEDAPPAVKPGEPAAAAPAPLTVPAAPVLLAGIVDAGISPEPPPILPPAPEPAPGVRRAAGGVAKRAPRRKEERSEPAAITEPAPPAAAPGAGITDFGGRR